ncbi:MAG: hypothetical protein LBC77_08430, partial [Spirochaetaceae bacterium]|nr:hypothetical protein [Spirochaetaceae bacterium]
AGVFRLFKKNPPLIPLTIGHPLLPQDYLKIGGGGAKHEIVLRMMTEVHKRMCALAGIKNNPYPPYIEEISSRDTV